MSTSFSFLRLLSLAALLLLLPLYASGQSATLSLSSGSGAPGTVVTLELSLAAAGPQPAAIQWTLGYSPNDISAITVTISGAASVAGKSLSCNPTTASVTCVLWGMNSTVLPNGIIATAALALSPTTTDTSAVVQAVNVVAVGSNGSAISTSSLGATVTIVLPATSITSISCAPDSVIPPAPSTCQVTISSPAPVGGLSLSLSDDSSSIVIPPSTNVPAGATTASFPVLTSVVTSDTTVHVSATFGSSSVTCPLSLVGPSSAGVAVDATVTQNASSAASSIVSPNFSTTSKNELFLAFVATGPSSGSVTVTSVNGAGLSWALVKRTNASGGTTEIWRAFAPTVLSNVNVSATLSTDVYSSITVMTFTGVDPSGSNGSGAIGATAGANGTVGSPSVTLTTTRDGSLVLGVGNDVAKATVRVPGTMQNLVSQDLSPNGNTYWVQTQMTTTALSGTAVTVNDVSPASDPFNLTTVEVLPPSYCIASEAIDTRSFPTGGGSSSSTVATGPGCTWTASTDSPQWITLNGSSGSGNGSFTLTVASNETGQARLASVSVGSQSVKILEGGAIQLFGDVAPDSPYFDYISLMYSEHITAGCSSNPLMYCPSIPVTRAQMAVFLVAAYDMATGTSLTYSATPYFQDVPASSPYFPFVQRIADLGITAGCSSSPALFCPTQTITQEQMAVFMIVSWMKVQGLTTFSYSETPYFSDVQSTSPYFKFIQKMMDMQFWTGCSSTQYCPSDAVLRGDMAPLVLRAVLGAP